MTSRDHQVASTNDQEPQDRTNKGGMEVTTHNSREIDHEHQDLKDSDHSTAAFSVTSKDTVSETVRSILDKNHPANFVLTVEEPTKENASQDLDRRHQDHPTK
jgi:hypothetical protein